MLVYLVGVAFISAALGAVMAGGSAAALRLFLLILIVLPTVVVLTLSAGFGGLWATLFSVASLTALNLSWLGVVLVMNARRREAALRNAQMQVNGH